MQTSIGVSARVESRQDDEGYRHLVERTRNVKAWPLFTTSVTGLYDFFLAKLPASLRQHYECRACRRFVDKFGGLVTINESGYIASPFWSDWDLPGVFGDVVADLAFAAARQRVTGVFLSSDPLWGLDTNASPKSPTGAWHHLHVAPTREMLFYGVTKSAEQAMAEKHEDFGMLSRALTEYPAVVVQQAHTLLTTGTLYRSEKCIGVATWLLNLHATIATLRGAQRANVIWRFVATAPPGFCHVRSTMIGTLLDDLVAKKDFAEIKRAFDSKMNPLGYQRPKAAPTDGQLAAAEKIVEKLASAGSLARRFATLEEVLPHALWVPRVSTYVPSPGVFSHLKAAAKQAEPIDVPAQTITWDKFNWTVLPKASQVELYVPATPILFFACVTASDPIAPPILQWDRPEQRNPVSWYVPSSGARGYLWGMQEGTFHDVTAITPQPSSWLDSPTSHMGEGAYFFLKGARDLHSDKGIGLFPEILKSEYHGIRAAMEAYSNSQELGNKDGATACGVALQKGGTWNQLVRVTVDGARIWYRIDRWD